MPQATQVRCTHTSVRRTRCGSQEEISRNLEPSQKLMALQKATGANDIDVFSIPYGTPATENVPIPSINFSLPRNISGRGMSLFFQY